MSKKHPSVIILAGPNGAGKSTASAALLRGKLRVAAFVNADVIARGMSAFDPEQVAISAGKVMLVRLRELAEQRRSFAFETTLASRTFSPWIKELVADGFEFHLIYLWLPSADTAVDRVVARIRDGGHSVPEDVIRRRYSAGLHNFFELYQPLAISWRMYNNANLKPVLIAQVQACVFDRSLTRPFGRRSKGRIVKARKEVDIRKAFKEGTLIDEGINEGVREALLRHKRLGNSVVVWRDGKVVWLPPEEIIVDENPPKRKKAKRK